MGIFRPIDLYRVEVYDVIDDRRQVYEHLPKAQVKKMIGMKLDLVDQIEIQPAWSRYAYKVTREEVS